MKQVFFLFLTLLAWQPGAGAWAATQAASQAETPPEMPRGLWAAFSEARHAIEPMDADRHVAQNPKNRQRIAFGDGEIAVTPSVTPGGNNPAWQWGLELTGYGTPGAIRPVAPATVTTEGRRLEYRRGPITEWYVNRNVGLEQGFTLSEPPQPEAKQLVLSLAITGGLEPRWQTPGQALSFHTSTGGYALAYRDLKVLDAKGTELPAHLVLAGKDALEIHVAAKDAVWPIVVDPIVVSEEKETAGDAAAYDQFGWSVSVSGNTALIGAYWENSAAGSAYVFVRSGGAWSEQQKLTADDAAASDNFGYSVSLSGDTALIGAYLNDDGSADSGSAYVFTRSGTTWSQQQKLTASDAAASDWFGYSVSVSGDTALIGAYLNDDGALDNGSAYVFTRSGTTWSQQQKLTASDAAESDYFGQSVSVSGDTALIGAYLNDDGASDSGSAYVFTTSDGGATWSQQAKLTASDAAEYHQFSWSVSVSGDTALIGARLDDDGGLDSGAAYLFTRSGITWTEQQKLTASDPAAYDQFGDSVSLSGDTALIGAYQDDDNSGAAYVFTRSGTTWSQQAKLTAADALTGDYFGYSVSFSGNTALIGAPYDDDNSASASGSAYFYTFPCGFSYSLSASTWTQIASPCTPSTATVAGAFGDDVETGGNLVTSNYGSRWIMYRRNASSDSYEALSSSDAVAPGEGYFIYSLDAGTLIVNGSATTTNMNAGDTGCSASSNGCVKVTLVSPSSGTRVNLVGNPFPYAVDWSEVRILVNNTVVRTPTEADTANVMQATYWVWNGSSYDSYDDATTGMIGTLEPFQAIWVKTGSTGNGSTVELVIPALPSALDTSWVIPHGEELPGVDTGAEPPLFAALLDWLIPSAQASEGAEGIHDREWYARLIVEEPAEGFRDRNNVLGLLDGSQVGQDSHDLVEMAPFSRPWLTIVFPHPDWSGNAYGYASDYRPVGLAAAHRAWPFQIRADDSGMDVLLRWQAPQEVLEEYELVDERSGAVYPANDPALLRDGLSLYMYERTRSLIWRHATQE